MIFEYAVDPSIFTNEDKAIFILESFGRDKGRLVSELKKDQWPNFVRDAINKSERRPIARHKLKEALKILVKKQKALYCRQKQYKGSGWLELTKQAHSDWPYKGILIDQCEDGDDGFLVRDIHLCEKPEWIVEPSITVEREATAMVGAVQPLLEKAREVMLIDRNFRLVNQSGSPIGKYKRVLTCFLDFLANKKFGPKINKLTYHIGQSQIKQISKTVVMNIKTQCNRHLQNSIPSGMKLEIVVWPWDKLHDRYVLTDIGGIDFGIGLDEYVGTNEKEVKLKRISNSDLAKEWSKFKQNQPDITISK